MMVGRTWNAKMKPDFSIEAIGPNTNPAPELGEGRARG
jgi:hypothetical protein